eukprot:509947_1
MKIQPPTFYHASQLTCTKVYHQCTPPIHVTQSCNPQSMVNNPTDPVSRAVHMQNRDPVETPPVNVDMNHTNPYPSNNNINDLSIDDVLSKLSTLNSINAAQLNALKMLISCANDTNSQQQQLHPIGGAIGARTPTHHSMHNHCSVHPLRTNNTDSTTHPLRTYSTNSTTHPTPASSLCMPPLECVTNDDVKESASCHQCKTKKDVKILFYCTKTRACAYDALKRRRCRKKYCEKCMRKYYSHDDVLTLKSLKNRNGWCWECVACIGLCSCRACKRRRANQNNPNIK